MYECVNWCVIHFGLVCRLKLPQLIFFPGSATDLAKKKNRTNIIFERRENFSNVFASSNDVVSICKLFIVFTFRRLNNLYYLSSPRDL
jgi:hypothetical protein